MAAQINCSEETAARRGVIDERPTAEQHQAAAAIDDGPFNSISAPHMASQQANAKKRSSAHRFLIALFCAGSSVGWPAASPWRIQWWRPELKTDQRHKVRSHQLGVLLVLFSWLLLIANYPYWRNLRQTWRQDSRLTSCSFDSNHVSGVCAPSP